MENKEKDILDVIDEGIQKAYHRFRIEELEKGKVIKRNPMLLKFIKEF